MQSGTRELASFVTWSRRHYTGGTARESLLLGRSAHQDASVSRFVLGAGRGSRDGEFEGSREVDGYAEVSGTYFCNVGFAI